MNSETFEGAVKLLGAIGAVDPRAWDTALREHTGEPAYEDELEERRRLNAGGTEVELDAVIEGPTDRRNGHRLVAALRFSDGVSFLVDKAGGREFEWPDWRLTDDLGTNYSPSGSGGSDHDQHVSFRTAIPREARWIELAREQDREVVFRVAL